MLKCELHESKDSRCAHCSVPGRKQRWHVCKRPVDTLQVISRDRSTFVKETAIHYII